jgi:drug/metabolite transporter (DMT)-like permease
MDAVRLVSLGAIWGSSYVLIKYGLEAYSPMQMIAARIVVAAIVLVAMLYLRGERLPGGRRLWRALTVMAVVANIIPFFLITWGEQYISASLTSILNSTTPLFTAIVAAIALRGSEPFPPLRIAGILLGFAGVAVLTGQISGGAVLGAVAVVVASASYGVGFVYAKLHVTGSAAPMQTSAAQFIVSSAICVPLLVVDGAASGGPDLTNLQATLLVLTLGVVNTAFAYLFYYRLITDVGSTTASFVTYLIPVFGVFLGWLLLDERLAWNSFVGAAMVIAGIAMAEIAVRRVRSRVEPAPPAEAAVMAEAETTREAG